MNSCPQAAGWLASYLHYDMLTQYREIIDESDVFVDVHKAIRRMAPAPRTKYVKQHSIADIQNGDDTDDDEQGEADEETRLLSKRNSRVSIARKPSANGREATVLMRRPSGASAHNERPKPVTVRSNAADLRQHLKHLGPSNVASRPKATKYAAVKIKPGVGTIPENSQAPRPRSIYDTDSQRPGSIRSIHTSHSISGLEEGAGAGLLDDAGKDAKDGVLALAQGYGTITSNLKDSTSVTKDDEEAVVDDVSQSPAKSMTAREASAFADQHTSPPSIKEPEPDKAASEQANGHEDSNDNDNNGNDNDNTNHDNDEANDDSTINQNADADKAKDAQPESKPREEPELPEKLVVEGGTSRPVSNDSRRSASVSSHSDTLGEMESHPKKTRSKTARSGSITENIIDVNGMKKVVLATSSSSDTEEGKKNANNDGADDGNDKDTHNGDELEGSKSGSKKKKKKKRAGKKFHSRNGRSVSGDTTPLINQHDDD